MQDLCPLHSVSVLKVSGAWGMAGGRPGLLLWRCLHGSLLPACDLAPHSFVNPSAHRLTQRRAVGRARGHGPHTECERWIDAPAEAGLALLYPALENFALNRVDRLSFGSVLHQVPSQREEV